MSVSTSTSRGVSPPGRRDAVCACGQRQRAHRRSPWARILALPVLTKLTESVIFWPMPRPTPTDRLPKLLDAAAAAFVEHGFHRTQMDDVAERLGVSKGTIYRAVDSKEALFAAVIAWSDNPDNPDNIP